AGDPLEATDTISFDPVVFASPKTIALGSTLNIADPLLIIGPASTLVLDASGSSERVFTIDVPGSTKNGVTINRLTMKNGSATLGAIIQVTGEVLTLNDVTITG